VNFQRLLTNVAKKQECIKSNAVKALSYNLIFFFVNDLLLWPENFKEK